MAFGEHNGKSRMTILMTGYEIAPFYKRGGLGDVLGSLPPALSSIGVDVRLVMPYYRSIKKEFHPKEIGSFSVVFDKREENVKVFQGVLPQTDVTVYFLGNYRLISVINLKQKRIEEFVFFDLAVTGFINWLENKGEFIPDIVHCNDWHTALIPLLLKRRMRSTIKTILTIHNLGYQGKGSSHVLDQAGIEDKELKVLTHYSPVTEINALGEGILHADVITTVSPRYAKEISKIKSRTKIYHYFRLREREKDKDSAMLGILNGIDENVWDPATDGQIPHKFTADELEGKEKNKLVLTRKYQLDSQKPLISFIGRMAAQKGMQVIKEALPDLIELGCNIIFLGSGQAQIEEQVRGFQEKYPTQVKAELKFNEDLAHTVYAASDFLLIPSLYEPCGLVQLIGMRYGTIPIASATGGLLDTIRDGETGFIFSPGSAKELITASKRALRTYEQKDVLTKMRRQVMSENFSWKKSAEEYKRLYKKLLTSNF